MAARESSAQHGVHLCLMCLPHTHKQTYIYVYISHIYRSNRSVYYCCYCCCCCCAAWVHLFFSICLMKLRFPLASSDKAEKRNERKSWKIRENITLTLLVVAPWQRVCVCVGACVSCLFYSLFTLHIN